MTPPSNKGAAILAASVAGATVAAFGSGVAAPATQATSPQTSSADLLGLAAPDSPTSLAGAVPAEAPMPAHSQISAAVARDRMDTIIRVSRFKREQARPKWIRPGTGSLSSCFCARWGTFHYGIDLAAPMGSPIYAAGDGVVVEAGPASGFGLWVVIQHENGDVSIYGHEYKILVHEGERVKAGQLIALVGSLGQSTGPHLHFEVRIGGVDGARVDPIPWLAERGVTI